MRTIQDVSVLHNGVKMPLLGLGSWKSADGNEVTNAVKHALQVGYRHIDTAAAYGNEEGVGAGIRESGVSRDEIFVTTKLANADHAQGHERIIAACEESLNRLGLDYVDLYLIHWPIKDEGIDYYVQAWHTLESLYRAGKVRAIGVSNFYTKALEKVLANAEIVPMVNQVELHPRLTQRKLAALCAEHGIQLQAYSPLMQGNLDLPVLQQLAERHGKSAAQVVLRWNLQRGLVTIPKSVRPHRIEENADLYDFVLSEAEMAQIEALNEDYHYLTQPLRFAAEPLSD